MVIFPVVPSISIISPLLTVFNKFATPTIDGIPNSLEIIAVCDNSEPFSDIIPFAVANKNTHKFHYSWCGSVTDMKEKNKLYFNGTRDELINQGYVPCKRCNP